MKQLYVILCLFLLTPLAAQSGYPVPPKNDKMLFYLQRSHNRNTIVYESNTLSNKELDPDNPIYIHWIRYEEGGRLADLSFIQRKAFGLKCSPLNGSKNMFTLKFNNFKKRDILLAKNAAGIYRAFIKINNVDAELESVYILSEKNALGMSTNFKYMDLSGIALSSKKKITERIYL